MSAEPDGGPPEARGEADPGAPDRGEVTDDGVVVFRVGSRRDGPPTEGHWLTLAHMERIEKGEATFADLLAEECALRGLPEPTEQDVQALEKSVDEMFAGVHDSLGRYLESQAKMLEFAKGFKIELPRFDVPASVLDVAVPPSVVIDPELLVPPRPATVEALEGLLEATAAGSEATLGVLQAMEADIKGLREDAVRRGRFDTKMAWAILVVAVATLIATVVSVAVTLTT